MLHITQRAESTSKEMQLVAVDKKHRYWLVKEYIEDKGFRLYSEDNRGNFVFLKFIKGEGRSPRHITPDVLEENLKNIA